MHSLVVLLGTTHSLQCGYGDPEKQFEKLLKQTCRKFQIQVIAEEMSIDGLKEYDAIETIGATLARKLEIKHALCDPDKEQRKKMGVVNEGLIESYAFLGNWSEKKKNFELRKQNQKNHKIRELYWYDQLKKIDTWPALFICGANHVQTFKRLLLANKIDVRIRSRDWKPKGVPLEERAI